MRYNGEKSANLQLDSLSGLNEAIENAVNLILEYEEKQDRESAKTQDGHNDGGNNHNQQEEHKMNKPGNNNLNSYNNMGNNPNDQKEVYQPRPFYEGLKVDQPMYTTAMYEMQNNVMDNTPNYNNNQNYEQQNYGQNYNQEKQPNAYQMQPMSNSRPDNSYGHDGNQMESPYKQNNNNPMDLMSKGYQFSVNHYSQADNGRLMPLERNQRYIKKLYCKTKKSTRAKKQKLKARNYASSSSQNNQYDDFMFRNTYDYIPFTGFYNTFDELDHSGYKTLGEDLGAPAQVIRYPVYVSQYDTELINRLYSIRNVFI